MGFNDSKLALGSALATPHFDHFRLGLSDYAFPPLPPSLRIVNI
jgi:hypothetical protein